MQGKRTLFLVVALLGLLLVVGALPAAAEGDDIPMWVHRARLAYTGRSSHGPDAVVGLIHIRDATLDMVEGAVVGATWTLPDGTVLDEEQVTNKQGIAEFRLWQGRGTYTLCVTDVTKEGWIYHPEMDRETCPVFVVP